MKVAKFSGTLDRMYRITYISWNRAETSVFSKLMRYRIRESFPIMLITLVIHVSKAIV